MVESKKSKQKMEKKPQSRGSSPICIIITKLNEVLVKNVPFYNPHDLYPLEVKSYNLNL